MAKRSNINRGVSKSFEQRLERVEKEEKTLRSENRTIKEYLYILTGIVGVLFIGYFILLKLTGFVLLDFNAGSFVNTVSEGNFSHVTIGTDAPYSQSGYGLVAYYSFDGDDSDPNYQTGYGAMDYATNANDGDYTGDAVVTSTGCVYGKCLSLDGTGDYIVIPNGGIPTQANALITLSAWVNWQSGTGLMNCIYGIGTGAVENAHVAFCIHDGAGGNIYVTHWGNDWNTGIAFPQNEWHLLTYVYNGTTEIMYVDASSIGSRAFSFDIGDNPVAKIGAFEDFVANYYPFKGKLDEAMIFNHSLSAQQVTDIYNNASNRFVTTQGNHTFTGINFGTNNTVNITLNSYVIPAGTSIQAQINSGDIVSFTNGVITAYNITGDLASATVKIMYNTDANRFLSPIAGGNITLDSWESVALDSTFPLISLVYPTNTTYTTAVTELNYTLSDETALSACWYFNGTGNTTITCGENVTGLTASQGSNSWIVYANDTSGNLNSSSVVFNVDTSAPTISFISPTPTNGTNSTNNFITSFIEANGSNYKNYSYNLYNSSGLVSNSKYYGDDLGVSAGEYNTCALLNNGSMTCWGENGFGQSANYISGNAIAISAGYGHTCLLLNNGNITCQGDNGLGQSANYISGNAAQVSTGYQHTCALLNNGNINCWGDNTYGQSNNYTLGNAIAVSAAANSGVHTCALLNNGNVTCWGFNGAGEANNYTLGNAIAVSAGYSSTCILLNNGNVICRGLNDYGQSENYTLGDAVGVSVGYNHACILSNSGNITCQGDNSFGESNNYTLGNAIGVATGYKHSCALLNNGNVTCWGLNGDGESANYTLGDVKKQAPYTYTSLAVGTYYLNASACDTSNNCNSTETRTIIVGTPPDTTAPAIVVVYPTNVSYSVAITELNYTVSDETALSACWYFNGTGNTTITCGNNVTGLTAAQGSNTWIVYANDTSGNLNSSSVVFNVDSTTPLITYGIGTENFNELAQNSSGIYVNTTWIEDNLANITFSLYTNGGTLVTNTTYTSATYEINWTGLNAGMYRYQINITDLSNNMNFTAVRNITLLDSCFNAQGSQCVEGQDCNITTSCYMYSSMCSGNVCDFNNFRINGTIYTLYQANGDANELYLNVSNVTFIKSTLGNRGNYTQGIVFNGKVGSTISPGTRGGNAGLVNITVPYFFNTTRANLTGIGGYSTLSGEVGGNGGLLYLQFFGLIRNFSDGGYSPAGTSVVPRLPAGGSVDSGSGVTGATTYGKIIDCSYLGRRDVDVNGDGAITTTDSSLESNLYNNVTGDNTFISEYDISCDGKLNVIEISKIGFQYQAR